MPNAQTLLNRLVEDEPTEPPAAGQDKGEGRMSTEEFRRRFPDADRNENTLIDIACPKCGNRVSFSIVAESLFKVYDDGTDEFSDVEWEDDSRCICDNCGHEGKVSDFTFPGLDDVDDNSDGGDDDNDM